MHVATRRNIIQNNLVYLGIRRNQNKAKSSLSGNSGIGIVEPLAIMIFGKTMGLNSLASCRCFCGGVWLRSFVAVRFSPTDVTESPNDENVTVPLALLLGLEFNEIAELAKLPKILYA